MAYNPILSTEVDAKSPIDQALMSNKIKNDFDDHEARILALEAGGGSGGSTDPKTDPRYGQVLAGFETNEAVLKRRKYHFYQNITLNAAKQNTEGFNPEADDDSRWFITEDGVGLTFQTNVEFYLGYAYFLPQGKKVYFQIKKGENFFGLSQYRGSGYTDTVTVKIDGQSMTALGIKNEYGGARADDYSLNSGNQVQYTEWFFGLDGEEHVVEITNNDTGSNPWYFDAIEVGYASKPGTFAVDRNLKVSAGRVSVRGAAISTAETNITFDATEGYGRTDALKVSNAGVVSVLKGIEPAMTQASPEISIAFSSGPVTSMQVKNSYYFPSTGFILVSLPNGQHHIASYTSKNQSVIAQHQLQGLTWQSQPVVDYAPLTGFLSNTNGDAKGDVVINLWGAGGYLVNGSNNKLDFKVTVNGVQTTHAATIPNGLYSADLVSLGSAIVKAMKAVKPLNNGEYFCEYNELSQKWCIGVKGSEVTELQLPFATGSNASSSIRGGIGFSATDLDSALSYLSQNEVQSMAHKVFRPATNFIPASDPSIEYSYADPGDADPVYLETIQKYGFGYMRNIVASDPYIKLYPDKDACGVAFTFLSITGGAQVIASVDYGQQIFTINMDGATGATSSKRPNFKTGFLSFPRGSHVIELHLAQGAQFQNDTSTLQSTFLGYREYFTKPKFEALLTTESIIKCFEIAPKQFFKTTYKYNYSPQPTKDNISTISYVGGGWSANTGTNSFNGTANITSGSGDYVDITFVLQGDGGGISLNSFWASGYTALASLYLIAGSSASEVNTLIQNNWMSSTNGDIYDEPVFEAFGLPAGTYTLRCKNRQAAAFGISGISIVDTVAPDEGQTISDVTNTGQGVTFPFRGLIKYPLIRDSAYLVPPFLERSGYREGESYIDYATGTLNYGGFVMNDNDHVRQNKNYFQMGFLNYQDDFVRWFGFGKSFVTLDRGVSGITPTIQPVIDGVNHANTYEQNAQTKGAANSPAFNNFHPLFSDHFKRYASGTMSNSTTFLISNTRGFKVGDTVIVGKDATAEIYRTIQTVNAGTSIVFTQAISGFAGYTVAANAYVKSYGFHTVKLVMTAASQNMSLTAMVEPLDITPSKDNDRRLATNKIGETVTVYFKDVTSGDNLYYPYFSDGRQATWQESSISITGWSSASMLLGLNLDLKSIVASPGTASFKITSTRRF